MTTVLFISLFISCFLFVFFFFGGGGGGGGERRGLVLNFASKHSWTMLAFGCSMLLWHAVNLLLRVHRGIYQQTCIPGILKRSNMLIDGLY